jgi:putative sterol carrier protein
VVDRQEVGLKGHNYENVKGTNMSEVITEAVSQLNTKMDNGFNGTAKFIVNGEGAIMIDENGARAGDEEADVTLTASTETFKAILDGAQNPTAAFMTGKLKVDGDMGAAMRLAGALA